MWYRSMSPAMRLAERLCRPQRVGVFGHRGVGKTTLLTMLYREAVGGRLHDMRLAATDARTADYLSDKILQLEAGQTLPATLAETELRFHLYHGPNRIELLLKDYQGEHVALGREEPIRDFLRDCDAVWLCLDAAEVNDPAQRLRRQQEVEQLMEDYLAQEPQRTMERPVALVVTKADLLGPEEAHVEAWTATQLGMTRHSLNAHCPRNALFAVSSLGEGETLQPTGLAEPLVWLASTLQAQDEARLEQVWKLAGNQVGLLERCVACFVQRYPDAEVTMAYRQRLREVQRGQRRRRGWAGLGAAACLLTALWTYDVLGHQDVIRFEAEQPDDPVAVLEHWQRFQTWHPTRHLLGISPVQAEDDHLRELAQQSHQRQRDDRLTDLRRRAADADADPEALWQQLQEFRAAYPDLSVEGDLAHLRTALKVRRDERVNRRAQRVYDELVRAEQRKTDLEALVIQADQYLRDYLGSPHETDVRRRRAAYLLRLDEHDIQTARDYSTRQPFNFQTRRELYQRYLDKYPSGGAFTKEAEAALRAVAADWDRHDFRTVRDHFVARPGDIPELVARCRTYLAVHPHGRFTSTASVLLRWSERVTVPGEYRVVLKSGSFDRGVGRWFTRGPKLSVELEVNGVRYGPSPIVKNRYDPDWDFEYPRRVSWKLGDAVRIRVTDHNWKDQVVMDIASDEGDPLALRLLSGEAWSGHSCLTFESDFVLPKLPKIE